MTQAAAQVEYDHAAREVYSYENATPAPLALLGPTLLAEFRQAEQDRRETEERWLSDLRQYKGLYDPEVLQAIGPRRSKSFVRKTRVKVKTVDSRVADLLFPAGSEKNWSIDPTPKPSVSKEQRVEIAKQLQAQLNQQAQQAGGEPPRLNSKMIDDLVLEFAKTASKGMAKVIDDQLAETRYKEVCLRAIHSGHLYGTGIVKGPLIERRVRTRFVQEGNKWVAKSESYVVPFIDYVPLWRFFPDMSVTQLSECRYVYERHLMSPSDMAGLADRKTFHKTKIREYIKSRPQGEQSLSHVDTQLKMIGDRSTTQGMQRGQFEVFERWGWLTGDELKQVGVNVPEDRCHESFFSNVWILPNGEVIKAVLQPINGVTWPYHIYSFDKDETSLFGEGLSAVMRDDQTMLNASVRMMLDNMAITAGPMVEINPKLLSNYEKLDELAPWKVWMRNMESPGSQAVRAIEIPSRLGDLASMASMFENNADETTAIPRYMSGENVSQGAAGTAAGMSMLMGAANIVIKDLVTSWDEGITRPFLTSLYRWNMQFNKDNKIKGDFDVVARGAASLVAKEVRGRQLNDFSASVANPIDAPYVKRDKLLRQRAEANELSDVIKTEEEVLQEMQGGPAATQAKMAEQMQQIQLAMAQAQAAEAMAKAERTKAETARVMAQEALMRAQAISVKVESVYAALQAGGTATTSPQIAPAGDEILRSAGWQDATPDPGIADLLSPNVQGAQGAPAGPGALTDPTSAAPTMDGAPMMPADATPPDLQPQTGQVGQRDGIETPAIDGAPGLSG